MADCDEPQDAYPTAAVLLSDELWEEEEEDADVYMSDEDVAMDEDEGVFIEDDEDDDATVQENPFEPVYPTSAALLSIASDSDDDENAHMAGNSEDSDGKATAVPTGVVLEALSLDNILPEGSRRRRHP